MQEYFVWCFLHEWNANAPGSARNQGHICISKGFLTIQSLPIKPPIAAQKILMQFVMAAGGFSRGRLFGSAP